ncbi:MAG: hypothetical protein LRY73_09405 [Bacillus sp. (in: Bacteria)]|nr:hypothetical protein [Bacillus sp. (in: firmicutes)]
MKGYQVFVGIALIILLITNLSLSLKMNHFENRLNNLSHDQQQVMSSVNNQTNHIQTVMNDILEEQSWITPIRFDVEANSAQSNEVITTFEWQIKELPQNAEVFFNYTYADEEDYTTVPAKEVKNGLFQVKIPFELDLEPTWNISRSASQRGGMMVEESSMEYYMGENLKYFVSMSDEYMTKSGSQEGFNLEHYTASLYGNIRVSIHENNDDIIVDVYGESYNQSNLLESVTLLLFENGQLLDEIKMIKSEDHEDNYYPSEHFWLEPLEAGSFSNLVINVMYSNGQTFEKEVYPR